MHGLLHHEIEEESPKKIYFYTLLSRMQNHRNLIYIAVYFVNRMQL